MRGMRGEEHFFPGSPGESQCVLGVGLGGQMGWVSSWQDPPPSSGSNPTTTIPFCPRTELTPFSHWPQFPQLNEPNLSWGYRSGTM